MVSTIVIILLSSVLAGIVLYALVRWLFKKDTEIENRRRAAAELAAVLVKLGLKRIPKFLIDYSVGDYSGMAYSIVELAKLFLGDPAAVVAEFADVFENVLTAKLKTETGRAYVAAKLSDAVKAGDVSVITNAPVATTHPAGV